VRLLLVSIAGTRHIAARELGQSKPLARLAWRDRRRHEVNLIEQIAVAGHDRFRSR
jgi:hypothetical protein